MPRLFIRCRADSQTSVAENVERGMNRAKSRKGRSDPLFLAITLGPYRRGDVWAWWALFAGILVVSGLILLRVPLLGIQLGTAAAVTGAGTALASIIQLAVAGVGLALGMRRLAGKASAQAAQKAQLT